MTTVESEVSKTPDPKTRHPFTQIPEFHDAMRRITAVSKEEIERREREAAKRPDEKK